MRVNTRSTRHVNMAAGADLVANGCQPFLALRQQAIIVRENRRRNVGAQFADVLFFFGSTISSNSSV